MYIYISCHSITFTYAQGNGMNCLPQNLLFKRFRICSTTRIALALNIPRKSICR